MTTTMNPAQQQAVVRHIYSDCPPCEELWAEEVEDFLLRDVRPYLANKGLAMAQFADSASDWEAFELFCRLKEADLQQEKEEKQRIKLLNQEQQRQQQEEEAEAQSRRDQEVLNLAAASSNTPQTLGVSQEMFQSILRENRFDFNSKSTVDILHAQVCELTAKGGPKVGKTHSNLLREINVSVKEIETLRNALTRVEELEMRTGGMPTNNSHGKSIISSDAMESFFGTNRVSAGSSCVDQVLVSKYCFLMSGRQLRSLANHFSLAAGNKNNPTSAYDQAFNFYEKYQKLFPMTLEEVQAMSQFVLRENESFYFSLPLRLKKEWIDRKQEFPNEEVAAKFYLQVRGCFPFESRDLTTESFSYSDLTNNVRMLYKRMCTLSSNDIKRIRSSALSVQYFRSHLQEFPVDACLRNALSQYAKKMKMDIDSDKTLLARKRSALGVIDANVVFAIKCAFQLIYGYTLYDVQTTSLCLMILNPRLLELKTGEGKSNVIIALLLYLCVKSPRAERFIDVVTSHEELALRESQDINIRELFTLFGLTIGCNVEDSGLDKIPFVGQKECYKSNVVFGTAHSFCFDILRTEYLMLGHRGNRPFVYIVADEVDSMFLDGLSNTCRLSSYAVGLSDSSKLITNIFARMNTVVYGSAENSFLFVNESFTEESLKQAIVEDMKVYLASSATFDAADDELFRIANNNEIVSVESKRAMKFRNGLSVSPYSSAFLLQNLQKYVNAAFQAKFCLVRDVHYRVVPELNKLIIQDSSTGEDLIDTMWSNGMHQFAELNEGLPMTPETMETNFLSPMTYFKRAQGGLFGASGTIGTPPQRDFLTTTYGVLCLDIPTNFPTCRIRYPTIISSRPELSAMLSAIRETKKGNKSCLIICPHIKCAETVFKSLKALKLPVREKFYSGTEALKSPKERLADRLKQQGFLVIPMEGDNASFYRSVSHQVYGTDEHHLDIRNQCVEHMRKHGNRFKSFVDIDEMNSGGYESYDGFLLDAAKPTTRAGPVERLAVMELFNRPLHVYDSDMFVCGDKSKLYIDHSDDKLGSKYKSSAPIRLFLSNKTNYDSVGMERDLELRSPGFPKIVVRAVIVPQVQTTSTTGVFSSLRSTTMNIFGRESITNVFCRLLEVPRAEVLPPNVVSMSIGSEFEWRGMHTVVTAVDTSSDERKVCDLALKSPLPMNRFSMPKIPNEDDDKTLKLCAGEILVSTHLLGRGADIKVDTELHVVMISAPPSERTLHQGFGRAGRNGKGGSCQLIVANDENDDLIGSGFEERLLSNKDCEDRYYSSESRTKEFNQMIEARDRQDCQEKLFAEYCALLHKVVLVNGSNTLIQPEFALPRIGEANSRLNTDDPVFKSIEERWAMFYHEVQDTLCPDNYSNVLRRFNEKVANPILISPVVVQRTLPAAKSYAELEMLVQNPALKTNLANRIIFTDSVKAKQMVAQALRDDPRQVGAAVCNIQCLFAENNNRSGGMPIANNQASLLSAIRMAQYVTLGAICSKIAEIQMQKAFGTKQYDAKPVSFEYLRKKSKDRKLKEEEGEGESSSITATHEELYARLLRIEEVVSRTDDANLDLLRLENDALSLRKESDQIAMAEGYHAHPRIVEIERTKKQKGYWWPLMVGVIFITVAGWLVFGVAMGSTVFLGGTTMAGITVTTIQRAVQSLQAGQQPSFVQWIQSQAAIVVNFVSSAIQYGCPKWVAWVKNPTIQEVISDQARVYRKALPPPPLLFRPFIKRARNDVRVVRPRVECTVASTNLFGLSVGNESFMNRPAAKYAELKQKIYREVSVCDSEQMVEKYASELNLLVNHQTLQRLRRLLAITCVFDHSQGANQFCVVKGMFSEYFNDNKACVEWRCANSSIRSRGGLPTDLNGIMRSTNLLDVLSSDKLMKYLCRKHSSDDPECGIFQYTCEDTAAMVYSMFSIHHNSRPPLGEEFKFSYIELLDKGFIGSDLLTLTGKAKVDPTWSAATKLVFDFLEAVTKNTATAVREVIDNQPSITSYLTELSHRLLVDAIDREKLKLAQQATGVHYDMA